MRLLLAKCTQRMCLAQESGVGWPRNEHCRFATGSVAALLPGVLLPPPPPSAPQNIYLPSQPPELHSTALTHRPNISLLSCWHSWHHALTAAAAKSALLRCLPLPPRRYEEEPQSPGLDCMPDLANAKKRPCEPCRVSWVCVHAMGGRGKSVGVLAGHDLLSGVGWGALLGRRSARRQASKRHRHPRHPPFAGNPPM